MRAYSQLPKTTSCPVCFKRQAVVLYSVNSTQAAQHFALYQVAPDRHSALRSHIEALWGQATCDVVRCATCGFCFADPYIAGDLRFYELAYPRAAYPIWKWEFERTRRALVSLKSELRDMSLLEIGSGDGAFIRRIVPDLVEPRAALCTEFSEAGRFRIEKSGVTCLPQDIRSVSLVEHAGRFDVVCMFQVLEHLDDLDGLFQRLNLLIKESAHLFVAVPNARRIEFNELKVGLRDMPPNHIGRWNQLSLEIIARRHDWKVVNYEIEPEGPLAKTVEYGLYAYLYNRQKPDSLANRVERFPSRGPRRLLQILAVGWYLLKTPAGLWTLVGSRNLGKSQWAHFEKTYGD